MIQLHSTCSGQSAPVAEMLFLHKVKWVVDYGIDRHKVVGDGGVSYVLGLVPTGIVVVRKETRVGNYLWPRIVKLDYKKERFLLKVRDKSMNESVFAFNCRSKPAAKHLWKCASSQRRFFTSTPVENPMVAHRRMAGVSSAPARKSKYVLPPPSVGGGVGVGDRGDIPTTMTTTATSAPEASESAQLDSTIDGAQPSNNNNNNNNKDPRLTSPAEKIRASSPTSIVDGRRQKTTSSSPEKKNSHRRDDGGGVGGGLPSGEAGGGVGAQSLAATGGLFTAAGGSPLSTRSSHSSRYRRRPQSESEYSHKMGHHHHHHHRHQSRKLASTAAAAAVDANFRL